MPTYRVKTLGCKVNQYDGQALCEALSLSGFTPAGRSDTPDVLIVNTCAVTGAAMSKSRQAIRQLIRKAPGAAVCVAGCYVSYHRQRLADVLTELGVPKQRQFLISHHEDVAKAAKRLATLKSSPAAITAGEPETLKSRRLNALAAGEIGAEHLGGLSRMPGHQRAFVKIQDGCDAFCTYCIVPYTRPKVYYRPAATVLDECRRLIDAGHREIVLCGVFLGAYGRETAIRRRWSGANSALVDLLEAVSQLPGLWRVRLSSLEPLDVTDELLALYAERPTLAPHFHLPLQAGSDTILRAMNRQYTTAQFRRTVQQLRDALDAPAITTDIIVGFPGESDADFQATLDLAREAAFSKIHAFPYSAIEPTTAWRKRHLAPSPTVTRQRLTQLAELEQMLSDTYRRQFIGRTLEGLVETTCPKPGWRQAMTDRYLSIDFPCDETINPGDVVPLKLLELSDTGLTGQQV